MSGEVHGVSSRVRRALLLIGVGVFLASAAPVDAQRPQRRGSPQDRAQLEERIRARMGQMIQARLGLEEEQASLLSEVVREFDTQRRTLGRQEEATRRRVEALTLEGGTDEQEARELLDRMADLRAQEAELFRAEQERLLEVLTPMQVIEFQALRAELGQRIRALRGRPGSRRRPGNGGPGPGGR